MGIATPRKLIQAAEKIYPSSLNTPPIDTSIPPPSPTRSNPTFSEAGLENYNVHLIPSRTTYPSTPPISATVGKFCCKLLQILTPINPYINVIFTAESKLEVKAYVQALFDEASALFGQLQPLLQNDSAHLPNDHIEDASFLDPGWTVHRRELPEPKIFAALYDEFDTIHSGQNNNNMFVNAETGGGRDFQLYADEESSGQHDLVPYDGIDPATVQHKSMHTSTLHIDLSLNSAINHGCLNAPLANSNVSHDGESLSNPHPFFSEDSETAASSTSKLLETEAS
jgi:hypothetical protein